jgi:dihydrofolate reductase
MKTIYYTATSLDGFIATEDDSLEWLFPLGDINDTSYPSFIAQVGALAMGSTTFEWMLGHAGKMSDQMGCAWPYTQPCWVFTHRVLPGVKDADIRFVRGGVKSVHAEMTKAAGDKNVWIVGGGDLAGQFHDAGLLDEAIIQVASVTLGKGRQLFPRAVTSPPWQLLSARKVGAGFAELHYKLPSHKATSVAR